MTPQERDLILALARRIQGAPAQQIDPEANLLIQNEFGKNPASLYLLAQAVIVQEQALRYANERINQLETQIKNTPQSPGHGGGFLGGLFGGGTTPPMQSPPPVVSSPPGAAGTFLRSAAATAAGVVGGELILDGLRHLWGGGSWVPGYPGGGFLGSGSPIIEETIININSPSSGDLGDTGSGGDWGGDENNSPPDEDSEDLSGGGGDYGSDDSDFDDAIDGGYDSDTSGDDSF